VTDLKITEATVQLVVNEQEPVFLQVLRGPIVVPARFVSAVARITLAAFRSRSSVCPQERQRKVRSDSASLCLALAEQALHVIVV